MISKDSVIIVGSRADVCLSQLAKSLKVLLEMNVKKKVRIPKDLRYLGYIFNSDHVEKGILLQSTKKLNTCTFVGKSMGIVCNVEQIDISKDFYQNKSNIRKADFTKGYALKISDNFNLASDKYTEALKVIKEILAPNDTSYTWVVNIVYKEDSDRMELFFTMPEETERIGPSIEFSYKAKIKKA